MRTRSNSSTSSRKSTKARSKKVAAPPVWVPSSYAAPTAIGSRKQPHASAAGTALWRGPYATPSQTASWQAVHANTSRVNIPGNVAKTYTKPRPELQSPRTAVGSDWIVVESVKESSVQRKCDLGEYVVVPSEGKSEKADYKKEVKIAETRITADIHEMSKKSEIQPNKKEIEMVKNILKASSEYSPTRSPREQASEARVSKTTAIQANSPKTGSHIRNKESGSSSVRRRYSLKKSTLNRNGMKYNLKNSIVASRLSRSHRIKSKGTHADVSSEDQEWEWVYNDVAPDYKITGQEGQDWDWVYDETDINEATSPKKASSSRASVMKAAAPRKNTGTPKKSAKMNSILRPRRGKRPPRKEVTPSPDLIIPVVGLTFTSDAETSKYMTRRDTGAGFYHASSMNPLDDQISRIILDDDPELSKYYSQIQGLDGIDIIIKEYRTTKSMEGIVNNKVRDNRDPLAADAIAKSMSSSPHSDRKKVRIRKVKLCCQTARRTHRLTSRKPKNPYL